MEEEDDYEEEEVVEEEELFIINKIKFGQSFSDIVYQDTSSPCSDPDSTCPCPFVSILNYLMLHHPKDPKHQGYTNYIKKDGDYFAPGSLKAHKVMDVGFDSLTRMDHSPGRSLFGYLNIPLLHGWLVNPVDEELYDAIRSDYSISLCAKTTEFGLDLPERKLLFDFFDSTFNTKLTEYGLTCLRKEVKEGTCAVLYVNGHYRVIYNHQGTLFYLLTHLPEIMGCPDAAWKSLELVDDDGFYVTETFLPAKGQKNIKQAEKWLEDDIEESLRRVGLDDKQTTKPTKGIKKSAISSGGAKSAISLGGTESAISSGREKSDIARGVRSNDPEVINARFTDFLWTFKNSSTKPYFEGVVKLMDHLGTFVMPIPFGFIKQHNKSMAMHIQDHYESVKEKLRQLVADYLVKQKLHTYLKVEQDDVLQQAKLEISDLPEPKCTQSLEDFVSENEMCNGDSTSHSGRKMATVVLSHILFWFGKGKCWGGNWDRSVVEVRNNGKDFVITKIPELDLEKNLALLDLLKFISEILELFKSQTGECPPYFDEFRVDVMQIPDPFEDPEKWLRFLLLMRSNFALKAPLVRSAFLGNVYRVADSMRKGMPPNASAFTPFSGRSGLKDWRFSAREFNPLMRVYRFRNFRNDKWEHSYWCLIEFTRHSIEHVLNYTKKNDLDQQIHDIAIVDLILAKRLGKFIAQFVRFLAYGCGTDAEFSSSWNHLNASECFDDEGRELALLNEIFKPVGQENVNMSAETGLTDGASSSSSSAACYKAVISCDMSLADILQALELGGVKVEQSNNTLSCGGNIKIYKSNDSRDVMVEGDFSQEYAATVTTIILQCAVGSCV
ncbi:unnamed protein product [Urochloa humidicola]